MTKEEYRQYLESPHWKNFRKKVYSLIKHCGACGSKGQLNIHHISYSKLWKETLDDVVVLCGECHAHLHNSEKMGFPRERWIKLHCRKIQEFRKKVRQDKRRNQFDNPLLESARRQAISHYAKQGNSRAVSTVMKSVPKEKKQIKSITKSWKKAHQV
jgi:hypothetical protein